MNKNKINFNYGMRNFKTGNTQARMEFQLGYYNNLLKPEVYKAVTSKDQLDFSLMGQFGLNKKNKYDLNSMVTLVVDIDSYNRKQDYDITNQSLLVANLDRLVIRQRGYGTARRAMKPMFDTLKDILEMTPNNVTFEFDVMNPVLNSLAYIPQTWKWIDSYNIKNIILPVNSIYESKSTEHFEHMINLLETDERAIVLTEQDTLLQRLDKEFSDHQPMIDLAVSLEDNIKQTIQAILTRINKGYPTGLINLSANPKIIPQIIFSEKIKSREKNLILGLTDNILDKFQYNHMIGLWESIDYVMHIDSNSPTDLRDKLLAIPQGIESKSIIQDMKVIPVYIGRIIKDLETNKYKSVNYLRHCEEVEFKSGITYLDTAGQSENYQLRENLQLNMVDSLATIIDSNLKRT